MNEVYLITNRVNGKRYVGVTCRGYKVRFLEHIHEALNGSTTILHNAIRKCGIDSFDLMLLESDVPDELIDVREQHYIALYNTFYSSGIGYNMTKGGGGMSGYKHTEDARTKISKSLQGHQFPESRNRKIQEAMTGREYRPEWRVALSQSRLGRFIRDDNPFYGKHHSEQTKQRISDANTKYAVLQLDPSSHEVLQRFKNPKAAGEFVVASGYTKANPNTCGGRISEVCRSGKLACTAYGFSWKFEERSID